MAAPQAEFINYQLINKALKNHRHERSLAMFGIGLAGTFLYHIKPTIKGNHTNREAEISELAHVPVTEVVLLKTLYETLKKPDAPWLEEETIPLLLPATISLIRAVLNQTLPIPQVDAEHLSTLNLHYTEGQTFKSISNSKHQDRAERGIKKLSEVIIGPNGKFTPGQVKDLLGYYKKVLTEARKPPAKKVGRPAKPSSTT